MTEPQTLTKNYSNMLNHSQFRALISAENVTSGLLSSHFISAPEDLQNFSNSAKGVPLLIPADETIFDFENEDVFFIQPEYLAEIIYGPSAQNYIGFKTSFQEFKFLSSFSVKPHLLPQLDSINNVNKRVLKHVKILRKSFKTIGAFQTRNIPHFGHEKIIETMLYECEHLVINPVLGPKKSGDATIECLKAVYSDYFQSKYDGRVSFMPVFANMFYAGPREAVHHALLREKLGFDLFSVGRDHAGADAFYPPQSAPKLVKSLKKTLKIKIIHHSGASYCRACKDYVLGDECGHSASFFTDISGSEFRATLREGSIYSFADENMQRFVFENVTNIFEV